MKSIHLKLIIFFCFVTIIPIIVISFFNHPTIDDFWEIAMLRQYGFPNVIYQWSHNINGRFFSHVVMAVIAWPFKNIWSFKIAPIVLIILFYWASIKLCQLIFNSFFADIEIKTLGILFTTCYFLDLPDIYQGLFWLSSSVNYLLSIICFIFILCWQQSNKNKPVTILNVLGLFLFSFLASGLNELVTIMWVGVIIVYIASDKYRKLTADKSKLIILIGSTIALFIQLFSTGNHKRVASYDYSNSWGIAKSSVVAIEQSSFHLAKHSFASPLWWFAGLFFFGLLLNHKPAIKLRFAYLNAKIILIAIVFIVGMFFFPALIDGNIERNLSGMRIINVSYFVSFAGFLFLTLCAVVYLPVNLNSTQVFTYQKILLLLAVIGTVVLPGNFRSVSTDLLNGKAALYNKEAYARYQSIEDCKSAECGVSAFTNPPLSLCPFEDTRVNLMRVADVFGKQKIVVVKDSLSKP